MQKQRIQFDATNKICKTMDRIGNEIQATTRAEVIRRALSFYDVLIKEAKAGKKILIIDKKGNRERVNLYL